MEKQFFLASLLPIMIISIFTFSTAYGHPHMGIVNTNEHNHETLTETIPIDGNIGLEKTTLYFHISEENTLPWGFVEGKIANPVQDYPVIIQMFLHGEASHFAQTDVKEDGSYEYQFRVRDVDNGEIIRAFEGDYTVTIFKVVYLHPNLNSI